jgi:uncharacterized membrane protein
MLDVIFALKLVHDLAAAAMFGAWLCIAIFMLLAHQSRNPSVVAVTSQFIVSVEKIVVAGAIALQPISGYPLGLAIGLTPLHEFWIEISLVFYAAIVACWLAAFRIEIRIRRLSRQAALNTIPLSQGYLRLFRAWSVLAVLILLGMAAVFAVMIWQPRLD